MLHHINENDYLIQEATQIQARRLLISTELELADLHLKNQRYGRAFEKYVNVLLIGAPNVEALIANIDAILERGERVESSQLLALGDFFQTRQETKRAIFYWLKLLDLDPKHSEAAQRTEQSARHAGPGTTGQGGAAPGARGALLAVRKDPPGDGGTC